MTTALGFYGDDIYEPRDMGETARKVAEQNRLRLQYDHLFAAERDRLQGTIRDLENRNTELLMKLREAEQNVVRLETIAEYDASKKARRGSGVKKGQRNRVVYHVTATMPDEASAVMVGEYLAESRGPDSSKSMKVTAWGVNGSTLGFVVDYTVVGGYPADIWRDDPAPTRQGMLNRVVEKLDVEVVSVDCKQHLRERVEVVEMPSNGP